MPSILLRLLEQRGVDAAHLEAFLNPDKGQLADPLEMPGLAAAADVIGSAVAAGREIVVFGDYDCDGVCATAILAKALAGLGAKVAPFIPERLTEGYGMSDRSVERMLAEHPAVALVVTVDNGITSAGQVAALKARGIAVIVTDHHLPGEELPAADALVDTKLAGTPDALSVLCGAGVAFFLARELFRRAVAAGRPSPGASELLVLAGIATVTDIMPLVGQNRVLVAEALKRFTRFAPIGLRELYERAARNAADRLVSRDFGFLIGPRINAAGRLDSAMQALELVMTTDREIAREAARLVDLHNTNRKTVEREMSDRAWELVVKGAPAQVIDLSDGHPGVAGIVAARVLERLAREDRPVPVCVYAGGHGSARSPEGINVRDAFAACAEHLDSFGGHAAAGGFVVKEGCLDAFRAAFCRYCEPFAATYVPGAIEAELWLEPKDLLTDRATGIDRALELAEAIVRLEPFGEGNPEPVFGLRGVRVTDLRPLGADGKHLAVTLGGGLPRGVWWGAGDRVESLRAQSSGLFDVAFTLIASDYGQRHAEIRLTALRPA